jgi:hypothetical protein
MMPYYEKVIESIVKVFPVEPLTILGSSVLIPELFAAEQTVSIKSLCA